MAEVCHYGRGSLVMEKFAVKTKNKVYVVKFKDVVYFEKDLRKIIIHMKTGNIEFYGRFTELKPHLDERFLYCHRSYIINMDEIIVMGDGKIYVSSNDCIFFGRETYRKARKKFLRYLSKKFGKII